MDFSEEYLYLKRCLYLAKKGWEFSRPNPCVGCVIVYKNTIIGEGFTQKLGGKHAEVVAIDSVKDKKLLEKATLYVSLEPCIHFGKTPPCVDLIIASKIKKVVFGCKDPNEKVSGKGIEKLKSKGIWVVKSLLEKECREVHKYFLNFFEKKRPYVFLKWAESNNGYIAPKIQKKQKPHWISSPEARQIAHQFRAENEAILVGTKTALKDNPTLDVRHTAGKNPIRIVMDRKLRLEKNLHIFNENSETFIITDTKNKNTKKLFKENHLHYFFVNFKEPLAKQIMDILYKKNMQSLLVEGGTKTLETFIKEHIWDEMLVFKSFEKMENGIKAPTLPKNLKHIKKQMLPNETLEYFKP